MTAQTPYERLKAARLRKKRGLVSVTVPAKGLAFDIPEARLGDLAEWLRGRQEGGPCHKHTSRGVADYKHGET